MINTRLNISSICHRTTRELFWLFWVSEKVMISKGLNILLGLGFQYFCQNPWTRFQSQSISVTYWSHQSNQYHCIYKAKMASITDVTGVTSLIRDLGWTVAFVWTHWLEIMATTGDNIRQPVPGTCQEKNCATPASLECVYYWYLIRPRWPPWASHSGFIRRTVNGHKLQLSRNYPPHFTLSSSPTDRQHGATELCNVVSDLV